VLLSLRRTHNHNPSRALFLVSSGPPVLRETALPIAQRRAAALLFSVSQRLRSSFASVKSGSLSVGSRRGTSDSNFFWGRYPIESRLPIGTCFIHRPHSPNESFLQRPTARCLTSIAACWTMFDRLPAGEVGLVNTVSLWGARGASALGGDLRFHNKPFSDAALWLNTVIWNMGKLEMGQWGGELR